MNKFKITAWLYINDEMEPESVGSPMATLEESQLAAQAHYFNRQRKPYSMSVSDGSDTWNWKPGRNWEIQPNQNMTTICGALYETFKPQPQL